MINLKRWANADVQPYRVDNPRSWVFRIYAWFIRRSGSGIPWRENFCHYWRSIFLWTPITWFFEAGMVTKYRLIRPVTIILTALLLLTAGWRGVAEPWPHNLIQPFLVLVYGGFGLALGFAMYTDEAGSGSGNRWLLLLMVIFGAVALLIVVIGLGWDKAKARLSRTIIFRRLGDLLLGGLKIAVDIVGGITSFLTEPRWWSYRLSIWDLVWISAVVLIVGFLLIWKAVEFLIAIIIFCLLITGAYLSEKFSEKRRIARARLAHEDERLPVSTVERSGFLYQTGEFFRLIWKIFEAFHRKVCPPVEFGFDVREAIYGR